MVAWASFVEVLQTRAAQTPDALALRFLQPGGEPEEISYAHLDAAARNVAATLAAASRRGEGNGARGPRGRPPVADADGATIAFLQYTSGTTGTPRGVMVRFDYVISLCDRGREVCPEFPGHPQVIHWSIPDPAASGDTDTETYPAFRDMADTLRTRIEFLLGGIAGPSAHSPGGPAQEVS